ncbi:MAG TPA: outer membrane beta-barrel protein [Verrucomicrobiae bacterium]|nr:outer membrane beta-barrel protein [Verrucomicrobiae bacterium]
MSGAIVAALSGTGALAQDKVDRLEKENAELKKRLDTLESVAQKEGLLPAESSTTHIVKAASQTTISGFVSTSYFYDTSTPKDNSPNGYLWSRTQNSFLLNKLKVTLASPAVERSGDKFDAAYRASLIWGQDAPIVNTSNGFGGMEELREAYVELNIPIGTGLNVKAGELISLLNFESGDGGVANPNFSQGNQWFFTGNPPNAGVNFGYTFNDWLSANVRVQNGLYAGAIDNNGFKTLMGNVMIKPNDKLWIDLIGFGGREGVNSGQWTDGGSILAGVKVNDKYNMNFATELDYFSFPGATKSSDVYSAGGWFWLDFTEKLGAALRADYISDGNGAATGGLLGFPVNGGQDLYSLTLTLNWKPTPNTKIQPEIRYDHTSLKAGFDGVRDRIMIGTGVSYMF